MSKNRIKKALLTAATLFAAIALSLHMGCVKAVQNQEVAALEVQAPGAATPFLKIFGKETVDVYLQSLDITVEVAGNIATTRHTLVFKNKTERRLEGELTFPLPEGRSVTYYALDINGRMRDAVPVPKAKATGVFEEIEQRRVDPGLMERVEGNNFRTRIYPFPANGTRTIAIGYEEELPLEEGQLRYRLPLDYTGPIEQFKVTATVWNGASKPIVPETEEEIRFDRAGAHYVAAFSRENFVPPRALAFALPAPVDIPMVLMQPAQGSYYFLASVATKAEPRKKQWGDRLAIIWDVSLSGTQRDLQREMEMLGILFADKLDATVDLYFLNNRFKKVSVDSGYKVVNGDWVGLKAALESAVFDGGTDFSQINISDIAGDEILFFSDGISTLSDANLLNDSDLTPSIQSNDTMRSVQRGDTARTMQRGDLRPSTQRGDTARLMQRGDLKPSTQRSDTTRLMQRGDLRRPIHCIVSSPRADYSVMRLIAVKTNGKFINLSALSSEKLNTELLYETLQFLGAEHGEAVSEVYPSIAAPSQGNFSIAGLSSLKNAELTLLFGFGGTVERKVSVALDASSAIGQGSVYKIWAQKKVAELDLEYERNRAEIMEVGTQFGIVTRNTSLIVLETLDDYLRYSIEPPVELQDAYYIEAVKLRGSRARDTERDLLDAAAKAANAVKEWWDTDFTPQTPKYPMPDALTAQRNQISPAAGAQARGIAGTDEPGRSPSSANRRMEPKRGDTRIYANEVREPYESPIARVGRHHILTVIEVRKNHYKVRTQGGDVGFVRKTDVKRVPKDIKTYFMGYGSRSFSFEAAEVIGYLDNPSPVYMIDMNDPDNAHMSIGDGVGSRFSSSSKQNDAEIDRRLDRLHREVEAEKRGARNSRAGDATKAAITVKPVKKDNDYLSKLTGILADDYQTYLKQRDDYASSPTFYFDMAEWFYKHKDKETALRILTNIAEIDLESAPLYRLLGYRLKEYGEFALEKFVCKKVIDWRPMEPQSHRDYALALDDNGETQAALDSLYALLTKTYSANISSRSRGIEEVVITEISRIVAKDSTLATSSIDERLKANMPVDVRVVINWNLNNTNVDLHIRDPLGMETASNASTYIYKNRQPIIGGRISEDNMAGYGPEQFMLKKAIKGTYRIYVDYYGDSQFTQSGPLTVMAEIFTKYGDGSAEQRRVVCLRLSKTRAPDNSFNDDRRVLVAEIEL